MRRDLLRRSLHDAAREWKRLSVTREFVRQMAKETLAEATCARTYASVQPRHFASGPAVEQIKGSAIMLCTFNAGPRRTLGDDWDRPATACGIL